MINVISPSEAKLVYTKKQVEKAMYELVVKKEAIEATAISIIEALNETLSKEGWIEYTELYYSDIITRVPNQDMKKNVDYEFCREVVDIILKTFREAEYDAYCHEYSDSWKKQSDKFCKITIRY